MLRVKSIYSRSWGIGSGRCTTKDTGIEICDATYGKKRNISTPPSPNDRYTTLAERNSQQHFSQWAYMTLAIEQYGKGTAQQ